MWVQIVMAFLIVFGLLPLVVLAYSFIRTGGGVRYDLCFYEHDKCHQSGAVVKRRYRSPIHAFHRFLDTLRYSYPLLRVYLFRVLSPQLREKIMITTAMANTCQQ